jgi:macrodomain Ter protein organizer (MatP/YcbG family)
MQSTKRRTIALTVPVDEKLERKAKRMGIGVPEYLRFLVLTDVRDEEKNMPTLSERTEKAMIEAMEDDKNGKLKTYTNVDDFFKEL